MSTAELVAEQRQWIVDTVRGLDDAGWAASTLCEGWSVEDLVAHLVARERNLTAGPGIVVPALHGLHDRAMRKELAKGRTEMVDRLEEGPHLASLWNLVNLVEFWVHAEDLARGSLQLERPEPKGELASALWGTVQSTGRMNLRRVKSDAVLGITDTGDPEHRTALRFSGLLPRKDDAATPDVTLSGPVGELTLYLYGRRDAAKVELSPSTHPLAAEVASVKLGV